MVELLRQKGFCQHHQPGMGASQEVMLLCRGSKFTPNLCLLSENPAKIKIIIDSFPLVKEEWLSTERQFLRVKL